jgi:hypothetical protein
MKLRNSPNDLIINERLNQLSQGIVPPHLANFERNLVTSRALEELNFEELKRNKNMKLRNVSLTQAINGYAVDTQGTVVNLEPCVIELVNGEKLVIQDPDSQLKQHKVCPSTDFVANVAERIKKYTPNDFKRDYIATVKIHGTNASIVLTKGGEIIPCTRGVVNSGVHGFDTYFEKNKESWKKVLQPLLEYLDTDHVIVYGEWAGAGIQKGTPFSKMNGKHFFVFRVWSPKGWVSMAEPMFQNLLTLHPVPDTSNILDYKTWRGTLDFEDLQGLKKQLDGLLHEVENKCPVAKEFGLDGVAEGLVFSCVDPKYKEGMDFKLKGMSYKINEGVSSVETEITVAQTAKIFGKVTASFERFKQFFEEDKELFAQNVYQNIIEEESLRLQASGLTPEDVRGPIFDKCYRYWEFAKKNSLKEKDTVVEGDVRNAPLIT